MCVMKWRMRWCSMVVTKLSVDRGVGIIGLVGTDRLRTQACGG